MLMALNAGCSGVATLHANSARDALEKLVSYSVLAGQNVAIPFVRRTVAAVVDLVVFLRRTGRIRAVDEIAYVPVGGEYFEILAKVFLDGFGFGGGLYNDQVHPYRLVL
jgi:Flp pilus assembly CpaF family ATPase